MSDKTEEATPRRLRKAQEEGDSGSSSYASQSIGFLVAVAVVPSAVAALVAFAAAELRGAIASVGQGVPDVAHLDTLGLVLTVLKLTLPLVIAVGVATAVANVVQTGGIVSTKKLTPKFEHLNPFTGFKNLFKVTRVFSVVRALVAASAVGYLAYAGLSSHLVDLSRLAGRLPYAGVVIESLASTLCWRAAMVGLALGMVDLVVTRMAWKRRLRMGKDEVKREHKDSEGDPQLKAERERAHQEMLAQVTIANVRQASVVVVNPTHLACALRYDEEINDAPVLVASGEGGMAQQIIRAAEQWGVPVLRDVPLAHALIELSIGDAIPEVLYSAVAEILREAQVEVQRP